MKILFATRGIFPNIIGGAPRHSRLLIEYLSKMDCEIHVIHPSPNQIFSSLKNIKEIYIPYGSSILSYSKRISKFIENKHYDVGYSDGLSLVKYVNYRKFPIVFNHHGFHMFQKQYFLKSIKESPKEGIVDLFLFIPRRFACKYMANKSDYVISLGGRLTELINKKLGISLTKIIELPNAIDVSRIKCDGFWNKKVPNSFLFVGGLTFRKGLTFLIKALNELKGSFIFFLVGDGPLKDWIVKHNKNECVKILGKITDRELFDLYNRVECFVFPSLQEGMPTVILEAMASYLPVIATDIGAVRVMVSSANGVIIKPNSQGAIKGAIKKFIDLDKEKKIIMGNKSRKIVENKYNWPLIVKKYYDFFKLII